jgi:hypothetical protein
MTDLTNKVRRVAETLGVKSSGLNRISDVGEFIANGVSVLNDVTLDLKKKHGPALTAVQWVFDKVESGDGLTEIIDEAITKAKNSVSIAVGEKARESDSILKSILPDSATDVLSKVRPSPLVAVDSPLDDNVETVVQLTADVDSLLGALAPLTRIANTAAPIPASAYEEVDGQRFGLDLVPSFTVGAANGGSNAGTMEYFTTYAARAQSDIALALPAFAAEYTFNALPAGGLPPLFGCYTWYLDYTVALRLVVNGGGAIAAALGGTVLRISNRYDVGAGPVVGKVRDVDLTALDPAATNIGILMKSGRVPLAAGFLHSAEFSFQSLLTPNMDVTYDFRNVSIIGIPNATCGAADLVYSLDGSSIVPVGTNRWVDLMGKCVSVDPIFDAVANWRAKVEGQDKTIVSVAETIYQYLGTKYGDQANPANNSIDEKYVAAGGFLAVAQVAEWMSASGPFNGMFVDDIAHDICQFKDDMDRTQAALEEDSDFTKLFIARHPCMSGF